MIKNPLPETRVSPKEIGAAWGDPLKKHAIAAAVPEARPSRLPSLRWPLQSLSRRRALPFSSFSVSSGLSGNVFSHSVPGRFSANG